MLGIASPVLRATTVDELADRLTAELHRRFDAPAVGMYLYGHDGRPTLERLDGTPVGFSSSYERLGRWCDPVLRSVSATQLPANDCTALDDGQWESSRLYRDVSEPFGLEHILTAPLVRDGELIGTLHLARHDRTKAFNHFDLMEMAMVSVEVSMALTSLTRHMPAPRLTAREASIVELVAAGLANREIGARLHISENTVKKSLKQLFERLGVHARAELIAVCRRDTIE
jgi:DNA-binding CsgD family transcriptional regulator